MSDRRDEELEIVGFNGSPLVECGRALPVVRRPSDGMYCVLQSLPADSPQSWHTEEEADAYASSGRWTRFLTPILVSPTCFSGNDGVPVGQLMVLFADEHMLDTADRLPRPSYCHDQQFFWRGLVGHPDTIQAACGSAEAVEQLLDEIRHSLFCRS
jgi:hypothetical protein